MDGKLYCRIEDIVTIKNPDSYEIDIDKIDNVADIFLLIKAMFPRNVCINETSPYYEDLKHLAKDKER